jgi:ferredoxin
MAATSSPTLEAFLDRQNATTWQMALASILPAIHEVDRRATEIWFFFFPLDLALALREADDAGDLARKLKLQGRYRLADQIDASHRFLYGHRYWPAVKQMIVERARSWAASEAADLAAAVREVAQAAAARVAGDASLTLGISAVGLMTLQQVGLGAFAASPGAVHLSPRVAARTPEEVLRRRRRRERQGLKGFITGVPRWTVTFDENEDEATFPLIDTQQIATAAASDKREHRSKDPRCTPNEGPIPVECRSASCGTCWVGVLAGETALADVVERDEGRRIKEFGYIDTTERKPIIRLACQARAYGTVSIIIPPWNGIFGRFLRERRAEAVKSGR